MPKAVMCTGALDLTVDEKPIDYNEVDGIWGERPTGRKRIRLRCPKCKRKLWSSISVHDTTVFHALPPHKPKGWWKKKKKVGRKRK